MTDQGGDEGFAPKDLSDGRSKFDWDTEYPREAWNQIAIEACYCGLLVLLVPFVVLFVLIGPYTELLVFTSQRTFPVLVIAWLGGVLGGAVFATKWLYHVVGKGRWHRDRGPWRFLTPLVSGGVSFSFMALVTSNVLPVLSISGINSVYSVIALSFLLGYFSDTAVAKLAEIAGVLFGTVRDHEPSKDNKE